MYKMIALDLDGTTLRSDKTISARTVSAITNVYEIGVKLILATGRNMSFVLDICEKLNIKAGLVCCNGSFVYDMESEKVLLDRFLHNSFTCSIVEKLKETSRYHHVYLDDFTVVTKEVAKKHPEVYKRGKRLMVVDDIAKTLEKSKKGCYKISVSPLEGEKTEDLLRELQMEFGEYVTIVPSDKNIIEIVDKQCSKSKALDIICSKYSIDSKELIAFGDNMNDYDMLKFAGLSVVMGNGPSELKSLGDMVTLTNDEDGVAVSLENFIKKGYFE